MRKILLIATILSLHLIVLRGSSGDRIKNLEAQLQIETSETKVIDLLNKLASTYQGTDIEKTLAYAQRALSEAEKINYQKGIAGAFNRIAIYHSRTGNRLEAIQYNQKALEISREIKHDSLIAYMLNNLGYALYNIGLYDKALEHYYESLQYTESSMDGVHVITLENIGNLFDAIGDEDKTKIYYTKAGDKANSSTDSTLHYIPDLHRAQTAVDSEDFTLADRYFNASLNKAYDSKHKAYILRRFAISKMSEGQFLEAEKKMREAIDMYQQVGNIDEIVTTKVELVGILNKQSRYREALQLVSQLLSKYKDENTEKSNLSTLHLTAAQAYEQVGNPKEAINNYKILLTLKDSIFSDQKIKIINGLEVKYNLKDKAKENEYLRSQKEKSELIASQQKNLGLLGGVFLVLLSVVSLLLYRNNQQEKKFNNRLEEEVSTKTTKLQQTNLQLKESNMELERFAHIASHDLKEPLRNISSFSQLLVRNIDNPNAKTEIAKYASYIQKSAKQMNGLIEDVLEFSSEGSQSLPYEEIDTHNVLSNVVDLLAYEIKSRNAVLSISPDIPHVYGDRTQLMLVFKNLIMNGLKYNKDNKPLIEIIYSEVDGFHQFCIKDNGIGIDVQYHESIFDMFKRLHNRDNYEGSGLGLAFCRKVVNKMGGQIWVADSDIGSRFCFTIPIEP